MVLIGLFGKKPKTEFEPNLGEKNARSISVIVGLVSGQFCQNFGSASLFCSP